jgi:hypothetical protein
LRAAGRAPLTPRQARDALRDTGTEQTAVPGQDTLEVIGRRPDLKELRTLLFDAKRPKTTQQTRRSKPMRIQITIDDGNVSGDGSLEPLTINPQAGPWGAQWRGPGFFLTPQEAAAAGVPSAQEYLDSQGQ